MVSSFHPHSMCKKVERVTAKTGCTSSTKWTISFEVSRFQTKTHLLQRDFIFLNLFELLTFCVFKMHHSKPHHQFVFHFFKFNYSDILDQRHHHNSCGEKVFTFSSLVSFPYCTVTMDNLHHLTGCLGQP